MQMPRKPVTTVPAQPRPPAPRYEGLFLEPAWLPIDEDPSDAEDAEDGSFITA